MSKCPVCGSGEDKTGMHVDCAVRLRDWTEAVSDTASSLSVEQWRDLYINEYEARFKAEAALAEMTENWKAQKAATDAMQLDRARISGLEAELAALKARRCETCCFWMPDHEQEARSPLLGICDDGVEETGEAMTAADFACNRWTARAEEGSTS